MKGRYLLGFTDPAVLETEAYKEYEKALEVEANARDKT